jgi:CRP-like cAMP-binding protein
LCDELLAQSAFRPPPRVEVCPAQTQLIRQGSLVSVVYRVERGAVKLSHLNPSGREIILDLRLPGGFIGAEPALLRELSPESATSLTTVELRCWPAEEFVERFERDGQFCLSVTKFLCQRMQASHCRMVGLGLDSARRRLEDLLSVLAESPLGREAARGEIPIPMRCWEVAEFLCVTPFHLSGLWSELERAGLVRRVKGRVFVRRANARRAASGQ